MNLAEASRSEATATSYATNIDFDDLDNSELDEAEVAKQASLVEEYFPGNPVDWVHLFFYFFLFFFGWGVGGGRQVPLSTFNSLGVGFLSKSTNQTRIGASEVFLHPFLVVWGSGFP